TYNGRFYPSRLQPLLRRINGYLVRWAMSKYKRLRRRPTRTWKWLASVARRSPALFAHWEAGARPEGWAVGAG
ncbi:MAG: group II intron reverse transcriptase/maturase, partial [Acidimicrobiales bacterium]